MSGGNRCDCRCDCGAFCTGAYCGKNMHWVSTFSGASNGSSGDCANCTDLNAAGSVTLFGASTAAAAWNATRPAWSGRDAKDGTNVCSWVGTFTLSSLCSPGGASVSGIEITTYYGTDDKWYMLATTSFTDYNGYQCDLSGEAIFAGGGAPMDCGTPGEGTPTFSLTVTLARYNESGTPDTGCVPPTSVLIEGDPQ